VRRTPPLTRCLALLLFLLTVALPFALSPQQQIPQSVVNGRHLFRQSCASCHDTLGTAAKSGPGLKDYYRRQPRPADSAVRAVILQGKGKMPGFSTFGKSQMNDLIEYLKTL
jgi:mono/diheme cytochrome c family protein